ncbi:MAG: RNA polymerase sigma-54 factor, partial [Methylocystis sp.]
MALSTKLMIRQGQSLVMTPQLLQAIKLLQFSSTELSAFLDEEMERNPLLQKEEAVEMAQADLAPVREIIPEPEAGDWARADFLASEQGPIADLGLDLGNAYEGPEPTRIDAQEAELYGLSTSSWAGTGAGGGEGGEAANLEAYVSERPSLQAHLN